MSNLETEPDEIVERPGVTTAGGIEILEPREVPLGGPRAMPVRRTLPQRARSLIGAWCFVDHYGPVEVTDGRGMVVPPHPHTGLQTVSWLFAGEIDHRDSVGSHAAVRPGELNLMTAGRGIQHSEVSILEPGASTTLHGAQLWIALPDSDRNGTPFFERFVPEPVQVGAATARVFIGSLGGARSTARVFSELVGAQLDLLAGATVGIPVNPAFEHGVLLDSGSVGLEGHDVPLSHIVYHPVGATELTLTAGGDGARLLLIGGAPLGERIVMWWNLIGRSHDEIVRFREDWQSDVIAGGNDHGRFGLVRGYDGAALPAPELPNVRLTPRG
jgi:hypothetical protein